MQIGNRGVGGVGGELRDLLSAGLKSKKDVAEDMVAYVALLCTECTICIHFDREVAKVV